MKKYIVKATKRFNDYGGKNIEESNKYILREKGDTFQCTKERYLYLKEKDAVELMAILN